MGAVFGMSVACSPVVGIGGWSPWCFLLVRPHKSSRARGGERCTALWRKHEPDARTGKPERTELLNNIEAHSTRSWAGMRGWSFYKARRINRCLQRLPTTLFHVTKSFRVDGGRQRKQEQGKNEDSPHRKLRARAGSHRSQPIPCLRSAQAGSDWLLTPFNPEADGNSSVELAVLALFSCSRFILFREVEAS